ncbi:MAG TPA: hypothetical protein VEK14_02930 [Rhodomicrobium sp.]|nr:hypothetical protein [Rhodomicrobium sp.]
MSRKFALARLSLGVALLLLAQHALAAEGKDQFENKNEVKLELDDHHDGHHFRPSEDHDDHFHLSYYDDHFYDRHHHCEKHRDYEHCPVSPN